jgi:hypothetical protein
MRRVPRKMLCRPLRLSRPLLAVCATVIASSAVIGAVSALNQGPSGMFYSGSEGRPRGKGIEARRAPSSTNDGIVISNPREIAIVRASLEGIGFTAAGAALRHEHDTEIPVRDSQGHIWTAWLDGAGKTSEIEIVDYDEDKVPEAPAFNPEDLSGMIARDGFQARGQPELRPDHFKILAVNHRSELVELHIDFAGQIYKQVWVR